MDFLSFSLEKCVRTLSVNAICEGCVDSCPTNAIRLHEHLPAINHSLCVGCGACTSVCPSEALNLEDFSPTEFFFSFLNEQNNLLSCQKNVPCLSALSPEHLIALAGLNGKLIADIGHCSACEIAPKCLNQIHETIDNVNYALEAIESEARIEIQEIGYQEEKEEISDRRDFFRTFHLRGLGKIKHNFEQEIQRSSDEFVEHKIGSSHTALMRQKKITDRRKIFHTAMRRMDIPSIFHVIDATKISFTSQKLMDEALCTGCQMCYRICPSGALSSDMRNSKIDFDPFLCIKCHLCHDVCEPDAITLSTSYNLKEWFEPKPHNLITYQVRRCDECDGLFSSIAGEKICRRCQLEEEEARELWGLN